MCWHWFAPKENDNDTNCFCDGGRRVVNDGRFRDLASRADCADGECICCPKRLCDEGVVAWPSLLARAVRSLALLVSVASDSIRFPDAAPIAFGAAFSQDYRASHFGTRVNASLRAAGFVPPCALPEGSTVLTSPVRSLIGESARSNS
jgi:hypothetical protein